MDQRRFEQTFRHIVRKLNNLGPDAKKPADLRPIPVISKDNRENNNERPHRP